MICEKCGEKMLLIEGVVCTSNPPMFQFVCPKCGNIQYSFDDERFCNDKAICKTVNITVNNIINLNLDND